MRLRVLTDDAANGGAENAGVAKNGADAGAIDGTAYSASQPVN